MGSSVKYFWASQNKTYKDERLGGYLWAPKVNAKKQTPFHWRNVSKVERDDLIFSYFRQEIVAVSIARSEPYDAPIPREWEYLHDWQNDGWKVDVEYDDIHDRPHVRDFKVKFEKYLPEKYSPMASTGGAQGYLFELPEIAAEFLFELLNWEVLAARIEDKHLAIGSDKVSTAKVRIGQAHFRNKLKKFWQNKCAVTNARTIELLRASHIVSWASSSPEDRMDEHNGLLLSPTYDAAFDAHLITFSDMGELIRSPKITIQELVDLGIDPKAKLRRLDPQHLRFLSEHRDRTLKS